MQTTSAGPLAGIRILDIATMIAAPLSASILGDYGAEVVKVELPPVGDTARKMGEQSKEGIGLYWKTLSRNKRSVALDLRVPEAQAILMRWLPQFDVLIENFRPGTLERWGIPPERLREANPSLIILRMTGFGQTGPFRLRQGFGTLAETMSGVASALARGVRGVADDRPILTSFPLGDITAGLVAVNGILAALIHRQRTGEGDTIDVAIYESLLKMLELELLRFGNHEHEADDESARLPDTAPRGVYKCADGGWIALSGSTQPVAERFLRLLGGEALAASPHFRSNVERVRHVDALDEIIERWCAERLRDDVIAAMSGAGCAVGPVETMRSLVENPQVVARQAIVTVDDPDVGPIRMVNAQPQFERHARPALRPGPTAVGADTLEVLRRDLGLGDAELQHLQAAGAIRLPDEKIEERVRT